MISINSKKNLRRTIFFENLKIPFLQEISCLLPGLGKGTSSGFNTVPVRRRTVPSDSTAYGKGFNYIIPVGLHTLSDG